MWRPAFFFSCLLTFSISLSQRDSRLDSVPCKKVELRMSSLYVLLLYQMAFMEPRSVRKWLWLASSSGERKERDCGGDWLLSEFYLDNWGIRGCRSWGRTHRWSENPQRLQSMGQSGGWGQSQTQGAHHGSKLNEANHKRESEYRQPEKHWKWWDEERGSGIST